MFNVIAGEKSAGTSGGVFEDAVFDEAQLPVGVQVSEVRDLDTERYGEAELSDLELLSVALQDAMDAHRGGQLAAAGGLDEVALRRSERRARNADSQRLLRVRPEGAIA